MSFSDVLCTVLDILNFCLKTIFYVQFLISLASNQINFFFYILLEYYISLSNSYKYNLFLISKVYKKKKNVSYIYNLKM